MNLTLSVVAGLLLILPGLAAIASWNIRATRSGATRPELPLTAVSVLLIAMGVSLCAHLIGYGVIEIVRGALVAGGTHLSEPGIINVCLRALFAPDQTLQPIGDNPFSTALHAATAKDAELLPRDAFLLAAIVMVETLIVMSIVGRHEYRWR